MIISKTSFKSIGYFSKTIVAFMMAFVSIITFALWLPSDSSPISIIVVTPC